MAGTHQINQTSPHVHIVDLPRPEKGNALDPNTVEFLHDQLTIAESSAETVGFVITARGKAFCAGADVDACTSKMNDINELLEFFDRARDLTRRLATSRLVTIAAVNGLAAAGGLELASSCDIIFASDAARFADRHARYGFVPSFGATAYLPIKIGHAKASWLMLADGMFDAYEAREAGLVAHVAPSATFTQDLETFVERLGTLDATALAAMKTLLISHTDLDAALERERSAVEAHARAGRYAIRPTDF